MKEFYDEDETPEFVKVEPDVRRSGFCDKCRNYYSDVPVINGVAVCPNCNK